MFSLKLKIEIGKVLPNRLHLILALKFVAAALNKNLFSNLGKFQPTRLWIWTSKVILTESQFQRRFRNIFHFNLSFFHDLFKRWANSEVMQVTFTSYFLLYSIANYYIQFNDLRSWLQATLRKNLGPPMPKQKDGSYLQEHQEP